MAASLNKVMLIGNLGRDPESRQTKSGGTLVTLRIATSESWRDKNSGERQEKTEWHNVVVFNEASAKYASQYLRKGSKVYIEGQLQTRKWQDQGGNDRYSTEVVIKPYGGVLTGLDSQREGSASGYDNGEDDGGPRRGHSTAPTSSSRPGPSPDRSPGPATTLAEDLDDEIPF